MKDYKLTIEDGVITWVENTDGSGNPIPGRLFIPKEVTSFDVDAWVFLGCEAEAIVVDPENDVFFLCSQLPFEQGWKEAY